MPILKKDTMYFCQIIELPQYTETVHMFKYDVIVEKENRDLVHHLVIYECPPTGKIDLVSVEERGKECGEVKVPDYIAECNSGPMVVAWVKYIFFIFYTVLHYKKSKKICGRFNILKTSS